MVQANDLSQDQLEDCLVSLAEQGFDVMRVASTVEMPEKLKWELTERVKARVDARAKCRTEAGLAARA